MSNTVVNDAAPEAVLEPSELELRSLRVTLGGQTLLDEASATFGKGGLHAVIGRSGAGKSVLLKAATGLLPLAQGEVRYGELACRADATLDERERAFARLRAPVVFVHQDPALLDDLSLAENVRFVARRRRRRGQPGLDEREETARVLAALSLDAVADRRPSEVSASTLKRTALARALVTRPEVLIVDEPTTGLDPKAAREVDAAVAELRGRGATLIVITHDRRSLGLLQPRLCWVHQGRVAWQGPWAERREVDPALSALLAGRPYAAEAA